MFNNLMTAAGASVQAASLNTPVLAQVLDLLEKGLYIAGAVLIVFGGVAVGTNLKDHNGPAITGGILECIGGAIVIACGVLIGSISL